MIGSQLAHYRITGELGAGGMGEVWRAEDTRLGREVALKVLPAEFAADPQRLERFQREARVLASLNHPNIATLYGLESVSAADSSPEPRAPSPVTFLAMELVEGEDLSDRIQRGPIPVEEAVAIALQIAEALEAAHEQGIVHRDLKPANVKITEDGVVKVLDFGLAKAWESNTGDSSLSLSPTMTVHATAAGVILGTAAYMSPEQARGKKVDRRADIWSFGVVLWEMLTGRILFQGDTVTDVLAAVVREEIDLSSLPPETAPRVRRLIARCLDREPKTRLRDIGEARITLSASRGDDEVSVGSESGSTGLTRRSFAVASAMTGVGVVLGFAIGRRFTATGAAGADDPMLEITRLTGSGNVISAAISPDGRFIAYVQMDPGLQSLWLRQLSSGQTLRLISEDEQFFWGHSFGPGGNDVVFALKTPGDRAGAIYAVSVLGGPKRRLVPDVDSAPAFSKDGTMMAFLRADFPSTEKSALMVAAADGSDERALAVFDWPEIVAPNFYTGPAWAPDGSHVVTSVWRRGGPIVEAEAWLASVSVADGNVSVFSNPGWVQAAHSAYLPDGRGLLAIARAPHQQSTQIWYVDAVSREATSVTNDLNDHRVLSLSDDGSSLVSITGDATSAIWVGPSDGSEPPRRRSWTRVDGSRGVSFAPNGRLVYTTNDRGAWELWTMTLDGSQRAPLLGVRPGEVILDVAVGGGGEVFFLVRNQARVEIRVAAADGSSPRVAVPDAVSDTIDVSRDGTLVYRADVSGEHRLFRLDPGASEPAPVIDFEAMAPAIDPAGQHVAFLYVDDAERFRAAVVSVEDGRMIWNAEVGNPTFFTQLCLRDKGLYLSTMPGDRANVWLMPLDGAPPRQLTHFEDQRLWGFAVSADGTSLAVARGRRDRDAVLMKNFRGSASGGST
jgi:Tol biopolymer transport system component